jgi:LysM repeat protein
MDTPGNPPRTTWHTTESPAGKSYFYSVAAYLIRVGAEPQVIYDPDSDLIGQFGPLTKSGRALRNDGSRRTNREGKDNIQVEVLGRASSPWTKGFDPAKKPNFRKLLAAGRAHGIPDVWPAGKPLATAAAVAKAGRSRETWQSKGGHFSHGQVPGNCVTADTLILCADLTWRPAGDLVVGDELIAFHEDAPDQQGRRFQRAVVEANELRRDVLYQVNTAEGKVRCNAEHPWLVRRKRGNGQEWGRWAWVKTSELAPGDEVMHVLHPWETERTWEAGWLAGMYDGEGSLSVNQRGVFLNCAQRVSDTADRMLLEIKSRVPAFSLKRAQRGLGRTEMVSVTIQKRVDVMRMLGIVRPPRLLVKADAVWEDGSLGRTATRVAIDSIEPCGTGVIAALSTSSRTYIAGGFAMHNTHWDPGAIDTAIVPGKPAGSPADPGGETGTQSGTGSYTVRKGDTLTSIAKAHGTTTAKLTSLNSLKDPDKLVPGQTLKVPAKKPAAPLYEPFPGADFFHGGRNSKVITAMGIRLEAEGCGKYADGPGPDWTNADRRSYAAWQKKYSKANNLGWTDADCNGIPGKKSWDGLKVPKV